MITIAHGITHVPRVTTTVTHSVSHGSVAGNWMPLALSLGPILTAVIALAIAWRQHATSRLQLKAALYPHRLRSYERIRAFILQGRNQGGIDAKALREFESVTHETPFLFGPDIQKFTNDLYERADRWYGAKARIDNASRLGLPIDPVDYTVDQDSLRWFTKESLALAARFSRDLVLES